MPPTTMAEFYDFFGPTEAGIKMLTEERTVLLADLWETRLQLIAEKRKGEKGSLRRKLSELTGRIGAIDADIGFHGRLIHHVKARIDLRQQLEWTETAAAMSSDTGRLYALKELRARLIKEIDRKGA